MPILAPMATWKPFTGKSTRGITYDLICAHTMVGTLTGSYAWANQSGNSYWHFGLAGDGRLWQCVDLAHRSAANLEGNWHVIPIETADTGEGIFPPWTGSNVPSWTGQQVDKLVELIAWLCTRFDIPPVLVPDTKPGRRGLAYHRQGINPWRVAGGELWSNANGKVCPGDRRVAQFKDVVVPRVAALVNPAPPVPPVLPSEEDDVLLILRTPGQADRYVHQGKVFGLSTGSDRGPLIEACRAEGVPVVVWECSAETFQTISTTYA